MMVFAMWRAIYWFSIFAFVVCFAIPATGRAERKDVIISWLNWSGAIAVSHVMKHVLEEKLDIPVRIERYSVPVIWPAMEMGNVDVYPDLWMPNQEQAFTKYVVERKTVDVKLSYDNAPQGIYMQKNIADEKGIKSVFDLRGRGKLFDMNGNGKGEMWIGPYNWAAAEINKAKLAHYKLDYEPVEFEQWIFLAVMKEAARNNKPLVFYFWEPDWPTAIFDLIRLREPAYDPAKWSHVKGNLARTRIGCEYPPASIYVGVSRKMKHRLPRAYTFFMNWSIPIDEVSYLVAQIEDVPGNPRKDPERVARQWVEDHPDLTAGWLAGLE